jgi:hypothetical protein
VRTIERAAPDSPPASSGWRAAEVVAARTRNGNRYLLRWDREVSDDVIVADHLMILDVPSGSVTTRGD